MGYYRAGFKEIVGVDIKPQPRYPFTFVQADAMTFPLEGFDAIHASPPCQAYSMAGQQWRSAGKEYPDLLAQTRERLERSGVPYIIENVPMAPLLNPIKLNGAMFGLKVRRVRYFEINLRGRGEIQFFLLPDDAPTNFRMGRPIRDDEAITPVGHFSDVSRARREMEIDWMTGAELTQAIPPAYTEFLGRQLLMILETNAHPA